MRTLTDSGTVSRTEWAAAVDAHAPHVGTATRPEVSATIIRHRGSVVELYPVSSLARVSPCGSPLRFDSYWIVTYRCARIGS